MTTKVQLVLVATFFLVLQLPQNLEAGIFKFGSNQNGTRGFLSFLFGRPRVCNCLCGRSNRLASRLQGGEITQSHEFPWLASIIINGTRVATGALINDRYILTANSPLVGATTAATTSVTTSATTTAAAAGGRRKRSLYADYVPVIPEYTEEDYEFRNAETNRWKRQVTSPSTSACVPKKLGLPVLGEGRCPDANVNSQLISADTGCAGISGAQNQACQNDAGAPVQYRDYRGIYQLVGILSMSNNCTTGSTMPTLYTRITGYVNWIYSNTQDACYCSQTLKFGF
ncbi:hypothetical protein C0J52_00492 [Blattella germanica]|nr:hypothetical protein C0J52_00492 [Blattella germanica]